MASARFALSLSLYRPAFCVRRPSHVYSRPQHQNISQKRFLKLYAAAVDGFGDSWDTTVPNGVSRTPADHQHQVVGCKLIAPNCLCITLIYLPEDTCIVSALPQGPPHLTPPLKTTLVLVLPCVCLPACLVPGWSLLPRHRVQPGQRHHGSWLRLHPLCLQVS